MKILLDENVPRKLVHALRAEGHDVESVHTLRLQGLENGKLFEFARNSFDICFTRDASFARDVGKAASPLRLKVLRVTLPQKPQDQFVPDFLAAFAKLIGRPSKTATTGPELLSNLRLLKWPRLSETKGTDTDCPILLTAVALAIWEFWRRIRQRREFGVCPQNFL